jgi:hypothetical protein
MLEMAASAAVSFAGRDRFRRRELAQRGIWGAAVFGQLCEHAAGLDDGRLARPGFFRRAMEPQNSHCHSSLRRWGNMVNEGLSCGLGLTAIELQLGVNWALLCGDLALIWASVSRYTVRTFTTDFCDTKNGGTPSTGSLSRP